jgi:hypothetical protein
MDDMDDELPDVDEIIKSMEFGEKRVIMRKGKPTLVLDKRKGPRPFSAIGDWFSFSEAIWNIEQRLGVSSGRARVILRGLCVSGEVRSGRASKEEPPPPPPSTREGGVRFKTLRSVSDIRPSAWRTTEVDFEDPQHAIFHGRVMVSHDDLDYWLDQQGEPAKPPVKPKAVTQRGKGPRISAILKKMYPEGVPEPGLCVRKDLADKLVKADPSLGSLDPKTLKTAIEKYNASIGNDRK